MNDNRCPSLGCHRGYLYNKWDDNYGQWREHCTDCNFSRLHKCRRKNWFNINFKDRRRYEGRTTQCDTPSSEPRESNE